MKYDFTCILNRDGMDAIAVNPPMNASWISFAPIKEGFDLIPDVGSRHELPNSTNDTGRYYRAHEAPGFWIFPPTS